MNIFHNYSSVSVESWEQHHPSGMWHQFWKNAIIWNAWFERFCSSKMQRTLHRYQHWTSGQCTGMLWRRWGSLYVFVDIKCVLFGYVIIIIYPFLPLQIPTMLKVDPVRDIQVLTPVNTLGSASALSLNLLLQESFAKGRKVADWTIPVKNNTYDFLKGDKVRKEYSSWFIVIQPFIILFSEYYCHLLISFASLKVMNINNDYKRDVFNGEYGIVDSINYRKVIQLLICVTFSPSFNVYFSLIHSFFSSSIF